MKLEKRTLFISDEQIAKLHYFATAVKGEIGGMASVSLTEKGNFILDDVFITKQTVVGSTECELQSGGIIDLFEELLAEDYDVDKVRIWWHSHGGGSAFFSSPDNKTMAEWETPWLIGLVINHNNPDKWEAKIVFRKPTIIEAELEIEPYWLKPYNWEELEKEIEEKVEVKSYVVQPKQSKAQPQLKAWSNSWENQAWGGYNVVDDVYDEETEYDFDQALCDKCEEAVVQGDDLCHMAILSNECPGLVKVENKSIHSMTDEELQALESA